MENEIQSMEEAVRVRMEAIHTQAPGTIGDLMHCELIGCNTEAGEYTLRCETQPWMRNIRGTLHGGMCATVVDQAMSFIARCIKKSEGAVSTIQLQVNYHRPLMPGEDVIVRVKVNSVTRSLIHMSAEAALASSQERICLTSTATFFNKPEENT